MKLNSKGSKSVKIPHIDGNAAHICPSTKMASEYGEKPLSSRGKHNWTCGKCNDILTDRFEPLQAQLDLFLIWSKFETKCDR